MIFIGFEKQQNKFLSTNNLKNDYLCNLKLWSMFFSTIIFQIMQKKSQ